MVFENVARQSNFTLENQNGKTENFRDVDIEDYLADMFDDPDQFVIQIGRASCRERVYVSV